MHKFWNHTPATATTTGKSQTQQNISFSTRYSTARGGPALGGSRFLNSEGLSCSCPASSSKSKISSCSFQCVLSVFGEPKLMYFRGCFTGGACFSFLPIWVSAAMPRAGTPVSRETSLLTSFYLCTVTWSRPVFLLSNLMLLLAWFLLTVD